MNHEKLREMFCEASNLVLIFQARPDLIQASVEAAQIAFGNKKVVAAKDLLAVTVCQTDEPA